MSSADALLPPALSITARERANIMEPDDYSTSCPRWFPIFLFGVGCIGLAASKVLT